jgi:IrrE N-terminal-like domain
MRTPPQLAVPPSALAVTDEVRKLLRAAGVQGQIPTPKSQIIACARLIEAGELDLALYEESIAEKTINLFHKAMSKVRGFFDRRTKQLYVDPTLRNSKRTFVTYHEVIHKIAAWQHIESTEEDDFTTSVDCETLFEAEANYGAAEILFQCEMFEKEAKDFEVSVSSAIYLSQRYDSSRHSSLRRFAERNHRPCLLLILKETRRQNSDGGMSFFISYAIPSESFIAKFGTPLESIFNDPFINPDHELGHILNNSQTGEIKLTDLNGFSRACAVECCTNSYHTFVLIHPKDLPASRKTVLIRL